MTETATSDPEPATASRTPELTVTATGRGSAHAGAAPLFKWLNRLHVLPGLGFLVCSLWLSWPLARVWNTRLAGENGDPFQTLWSWRWLLDALRSLQNPFFTERAYYPRGGSLVFQTFDLPTAIVTLPLWSVCSPVAVYNLGLLFAFVMTAFGMYFLVLELTEDRWAAFGAGALFTATPFHIVQSSAHMHLASAGWLPLYFLYLQRVIAHGTRKDAVLGGVFLTLASLASWYFLVFAATGSAVLFANALLRDRKSLFARAFVVRAAQLGAVFALLAGPLIVALLRAKSAEEIVGSHDPHEFSADLYSFFFPNILQSWKDAWGGHAVRWSGNAGENGTYLGYSVLLAAVSAGVTCGWRARLWLSVAVVALLLALGPSLHVDGASPHAISLPYAWLLSALPSLNFMGVPIRFGCLMYLGLLACWGLAIARLRSWLTERRPRAIADKPYGMASATALCAIVPLALGLLEYEPAPFQSTEAIEHPIMLEWARDPAKFSVLDISGTSRMLWHATLHRKPTVGGYLTRIPRQTDIWYANLDVVLALIKPDFVNMQPRIERIEGPIDFDWGKRGPDRARIRPKNYRAVWKGTLLVPRTGQWTFTLSSDDGARVDVDGSTAVDNAGSHEFRARSAQRQLSEGRHDVVIEYEQLGGGAAMRVEWEGPGQPRQVIPREQFTSAHGEAGLDATYKQGPKGCPLDETAARSKLRELGVRYVITENKDYSCLRHNYGTTEIYRAHGIRAYEISDAAQHANAAP